MNDPFGPTLLSRVEDAGLNASAPPQQRWLDGWIVRYSPGKAKRARCINAVATGRMPAAEKLALAAEVFREAGLPMVVRITPFTQPPDLDATLDSMGLARFDDTRVMVADLSRLPRRPLAAGLALEPAEPDRYAQVVGELRGSPPEQRAAHAERLSHSPIPYQGMLVMQGREILACGQFAREGDLVGIYDVFTAETARNRGLATSLCAQLLNQAIAQGARTAYLQVDADNKPARSAYARLGFSDGYAYHYRAADPMRA